MSKIYATYETRDEAIRCEIVDPIEDGTGRGTADLEFDVEAIADRVLMVAGNDDYLLDPRLDHDEYWAIVMSHAR